jgi:hypothetical protein
MTGSPREPTPAPDEAAAQMREATDKLRDQGWKLAPPNTPLPPTQPDHLDAESDV